MDKFLLLSLFAISLRWFLFRYKLTAWFRGLLQSPNWWITNELLACCYCQTIEASVVVYGSLYLAGELTFQVSHVFAILANGWIAIAIDYWIEQAIARMELAHSHNPGQQH